MKICLYARVSLDENSTDKRFQDAENQLMPLREYAKAMNWEIVDEYIDHMSGSNPARPAFRKMMQDVLMRRFQGILVWKLDRFSREGIIPTMRLEKSLLGDIGRRFIVLC